MLLCRMFPSPHPSPQRGEGVFRANHYFVGILQHCLPVALWPELMMNWIATKV